MLSHGVEFLLRLFPKLSPRQPAIRVCSEVWCQVLIFFAVGAVGAAVGLAVTVGCLPINGQKSRNDLQKLIPPESERAPKKKKKKLYV